MNASLLTMLMGDTEMTQEAIQNFVAEYRPIVYAVLQEFFNMYQDLSNNEEFFATQARMRHNTFSAYLNAGFTPEQAMAFMLNSDASRSEMIRAFTSRIPTTSAS